MFLEMSSNVRTFLFELKNESGNVELQLRCRLKLFQEGGPGFFVDERIGLLRHRIPLAKGIILPWMSAEANIDGPLLELLKRLHVVVPPAWQQPIALQILTGQRVQARTAVYSCRVLPFLLDDVEEIGHGAGSMSGSGYALY